MDNPIVWLAITFAFYYVAGLLRKRTGWVVLNPILITIIVIICLLKLSDVTYDTYQEGGKYIEFWLKPGIGCAFI